MDSNNFWGEQSEAPSPVGAKLEDMHGTTQKSWYVLHVIYGSMDRL